MEKNLYHGDLKKTCIKEQELGQLLSGGTLARYEIPRNDEYEEQFQIWLEACGFDPYGHWYGTYLIPFIDKNDRFNNGTFAVFPYYWGDDDNLALIPNFIYFPENIQIFWYKYPFRGATISENLSPEEFREMLKRCSESLSRSLAAKKG